MILFFFPSSLVFSSSPAFLPSRRETFMRNRKPLQNHIIRRPSVIVKTMQADLVFFFRYLSETSFNLYACLLSHTCIFTALLSLAPWEYRKNAEKPATSIKLLLSSSHSEVSGFNVLWHTSVNIIYFIFYDYFYTKAMFFKGFQVFFANPPLFSQLLSVLPGSHDVML